MSTRTPPGLGPRGRRQWRALVSADPGLNGLTEPRREIAIEVCQIADLIDVLRRAMDESAGIFQDTDFGTRIHPAVAEIAKQQALHARLITALRLPDSSGRRPQRRGIRGVYRPGHDPGTVGKVSALDRARATAAQTAYPES